MKMQHIDEGKLDEVPKQIQELNGKERGAILILIDSRMPCDNEVKGQGCDGKHEHKLMSYGINPRLLHGILHQAADKIGSDTEGPIDESMEELFGNDEDNEKE